jgi:hypothetical protein
MTRNQEDSIMALAFVIIVFLFGCLAGWSTRAWSTIDKQRRAEAERNINQADYLATHTAKMKADFLAGRGR